MRKAATLTIAATAIAAMRTPVPIPEPPADSGVVMRNSVAAVPTADSAVVIRTTVPIRANSIRPRRRDTSGLGRA
jgi:hypothetical protein